MKDFHWFPMHLIFRRWTLKLRSTYINRTVYQETVTVTVVGKTQVKVVGCSAPNGAMQKKGIFAWAHWATLPRYGDFRGGGSWKSYQEFRKQLLLVGLQWAWCGKPSEHHLWWFLQVQWIISMTSNIGLIHVYMISFMYVSIMILTYTTNIQYTYTNVHGQVELQWPTTWNQKVIWGRIPHILNYRHAGRHLPAVRHATIRLNIRLQGSPFWYFSHNGNNPQPFIAGDLMWVWMIVCLSACLSTSLSICMHGRMQVGM